MTQKPSTTRRLRQTAIAGLAGFPERRILLVSDNRDALESDAVLLAAFGQWLQRAYDGASALEVAREFDAEIVFLDLDTPGVDVELARRLRTQATVHPVRLVAYTSPSADRPAADPAAFDYVITKPVAMSRLFSILRDF